MIRRSLASPRRLRRLAWTSIAGGALCFALAVVLRDGGDHEQSRSATSSLLFALGFMIAVGGALGEARAGALFLEVARRPARRRAILEAVVGIVGCLVGCVALGGVEPAGIGRVFRPILAALLAGGLGAGLAGLFTLAWFYGLDWAAGRMERLDERGVEEARRWSNRGR